MAIELVVDDCWATLPAELQQILAPHFTGSLHLQAAFDDAAEAQELLRDIVGCEVDETTLEDLAADLESWRTSSERSFTATRQRLVRARLGEPRLPPRAEASPASASASAFLDLARRGIKLERRVNKSSEARALASGVQSREEVETAKRETDGWQS